MKSRFISLVLSFMLLFSISLQVCGQVSLPLVIDNADILSVEVEDTLEKNAQALRSEYQCDIVILTVNTLHSKSAQEYADDFYDRYGYGIGVNHTGILFLVAMEEREWYISTCGDAIYTFSDADTQRLGEYAFSHLYGSNYSDVFYAYLSSLPQYFVSDDNSPNVALSVVIGLIVASLAILIMRSSMRTNRRQQGAVNYVKSGTFHIKQQQDLFLYSNISKVRREQNNSGSKTSTHRSSSGRTHGGSGGRF